MGFHKFSGAELIDHGGDSSDGHRKIIRPGLYGADDFHAFGICPGVQLRVAAAEFPDKFLHISGILIRAAHPVLSPVGVSRELKIQIRHHLSSPLRPRSEHFLIRPRGPVIFGIRDSPLLRRQRAEHKGFPGPVADGQEGLCDPEHHGNRRIIILKTIKIRVIMGRQKDYSVRLLSRNAPQNIPRFLPPLYPACRIKPYQNFRFFSLPDPFFYVRLDDGRICLGHGKSRGIFRPGDILGVERCGVNLPVALFLYGNKGGRAFYVRLIHRKIDPPFLPLVDITHHQLALYIRVFITVGRGFSQVCQRKGLRPVCHELRLVCPQLKDMLLSFPVSVAHHGPLKFPAIHLYTVTAHLRKADALHLRGYHLPRLSLCQGAGRPIP